VLGERARPDAGHSGPSSHHYTTQVAEPPARLATHGCMTHALWGAPGRLGRHLSLLASDPRGAGRQQLRPAHRRRLRAPAALGRARALQAGTAPAQRARPGRRKPGRPDARPDARRVISHSAVQAHAIAAGRAQRGCVQARGLQPPALRLPNRPRRPPGARTPDAGGRRPGDSCAASLVGSGQSLGWPRICCGASSRRGLPHRKQNGDCTSSRSAAGRPGQASRASAWRAARAVRRGNRVCTRAS